MKRFYLSAFVLLITASALLAQTTPVTVFESGKEGHKSYRIPAIVNLKDGTLLAFAEGRVNNAGDFGDINIVLKRSTDCCGL
jgi:sialidase-1